MGIIDAFVVPVKSLVNTLKNPFTVPIGIIMRYPFSIVFPHHQLKDTEREAAADGKKLTRVANRWLQETDPYPQYMKYTNQRFRGIIGIDFERCTGCRRCERICPNKIIRMVPRSDEEILARFPDVEVNPINKKKVYPEIYYGRCLYCGYCGEEMVGGCPFDALNLTNLYDANDVFDDNLIFTPEKLHLVVEKVGRGTQNWWTQEVKKPKPKKPAPAKAAASGD